MNKIITYFSVGSAAFALVFGFERNTFCATVVALICIFLAFIGFKIENYI